MPDTTVVNVTICMGSSCFSRGNSRNIEVLRRCVEEAGGSAVIETRGHLCENMCKSGPNLIIDGTVYQNVQPTAVAGLLRHHIAANNTGG